MTEHPILFNAQMVRAVLSGQKTQTRRVMRQQPAEDFTLNRLTGQVQHLPSLTELINQGCGISQAIATHNTLLHKTLKRVPLFIEECQVGFENQKSPFGKARDTLWVRETCQAVEKESGLDGILYRADECLNAQALAREAIKSANLDITRWYE